MEIKIGDKTAEILDPIVTEGYANKIRNQIFKTLPLREEGKDWKSHIDTLLLELHGASDILSGINFVSLIAKLSILGSLSPEVFRKTIFECCGLVSELVSKAEEDV